MAHIESAGYSLADSDEAFIEVITLMGVGFQGFEQVQDVIASLPATDKGHINDLLVHTR